jgi:hypothetical protein
MILTSERVDEVSQGPDRRAGCRLESAEQKGKVAPARRLQLRLEIATLPSYMSSVDLDSFGQLSVFLSSAEPSSRTHQSLIAALAAVRTLAALQLDNSSNERRPASAGAAYGPT